jgi:hypothetical protein
MAALVIAGAIATSCTAGFVIVIISDLLQNK